MRKGLLILTILVPPILADAEEAQPAPLMTNAVQRQTNSARPWQQRRMSEEGDQRYTKQSREERRLILMERELRRMGITEEEKEQVNALQIAHKQKMSANAKRTAEARERLSRLMDEGAPMDMIEEAIDDIAAAQAEQLRILVYNRMEMERILGREKYDEFMKNARKQFQKHGRRGGPALPPRPGLPPVPGQPSSDPVPPEAPAPPVDPVP